MERVLKALNAASPRAKRSHGAGQGIRDGLDRPGFRHQLEMQN